MSAKPRITTRPPYDPAQFARDSETRLRQLDPSTRPTLAPPPLALDMEPEAVVADWVPTLAVSRSELEWFELPQTACALLLRVNGCSTVAEIAEASGVPVNEAARFFEDLARQRVVRWR